MRALTNRVTAGPGAVTRVKREVIDKVGTNFVEEAVNVDLDGWACRYQLNMS